MALLYMMCPGSGIPCSNCCLLATSFRSLVTILFYLKLPTFCSIILLYPWVQSYLPLYSDSQPSADTWPYSIIGIQFPIGFTYGISWITPFRCVTIYCLHALYHTNLKPQIVSAKSLYMFFELRMTVAEMILSRLQWPIGQRHSATNMRKKAFGFDRHQLLTQWDLISAYDWGV